MSPIMNKEAQQVPRQDLGYDRHWITRELKKHSHDADGRHTTKFAITWGTETGKSTTAGDL